MRRAFCVRYLAVLVLPWTGGACSADASGPSAVTLVEQSAASGPAADVELSSVPASSTSDPKPAESAELIDALDGTGGARPSPAGGQACKLALLGDPGSNPGANFAEWIGQRGPVVDRHLTGPSLEGFTVTKLESYQVVLLDFLAPTALLGISPQDLANWVERGGRVIALSGYGDYPEVVAVQNRLLEPVSLGFVSDTPVWGPVTQFEPHPITDGLDSLTFVGGREVSHDPLDEVIMTVSDAAVPVGVVATRGAGRLFLFGDEWVTFDSEWVAMPEIEQFWVNVFDWLGGCKLTPISMIK